MNDVIDFTGISDADIRAYLLDNGISSSSTLTPATVSAIAADRNTATSSKTLNTIDTILKYLDKGLSIASKNGLIGKTQVASMYPSLAGLTAADATTTTPTSNAPTTNTGFNIDFSDPKTLIIIFLILLILFYFFFWYSPKSAKVKR